MALYQVACTFSEEAELFLITIFHFQSLTPLTNISIQTTRSFFDLLVNILIIFFRLKNVLLINFFPPKKNEKEKKSLEFEKYFKKKLSTTIKNRPYNKKLRHELFFQHYSFKLLRNVFLSILSLYLSHYINNRESHWTVTTHVYCMVTVDSIFLRLHASVSHELSSVSYTHLTLPTKA